MSKLPRPFRHFEGAYPEVFQRYQRLGEALAQAGPLDEKTRELIKLGMSAALRGESAVKSHTHRALEAGATEAEIEHTVLVGITTFGFPTMMTALMWAREAIEHHEP